MKRSVQILSLVLVLPVLLSMPACTSRLFPGGPVSPLPIVGTPSFTPTVVVTSTGPGSCGVLGANALAAAPTIKFLALPIDQYSAAIFSVLGGSCGQSFSQIAIYVSNSGTSASSLELAVYENANRILTTPLGVPGSFTGWMTVPITTFTPNCGDTLALTAHATGPNLSLGQNGNISPDCWFDTGNEPNPMPATYPHPTILTQIYPGPCLEMGLEGNCGSVTPSPTPTFTPTAVVTAQACTPTPISIQAGSAGMTYGQVRAYVIRSQANWDSYLGTNGNAPPVDFSNQMVLAVNWGTEACTPGGGLVLNCGISSACVGASNITATVAKGSTCTCGGGCTYTDAGNQVVAVILPTSSLPVSIPGITDIVENQ